MESGHMYMYVKKYLEAHFRIHSCSGNAYHCGAAISVHSPFLASGPFVYLHGWM